MVLNDPQYQLNDLKAQLKQLQNDVRAALPGNRPSAGPNHPLSPTTSTGQEVPGGGDSDFRSRALTTAEENALASVESLQSVQTQLVSFNLAAATAYTLRTEFLRPDPVVGQVYRATIGGSFVRGVGAAYTATISVDVTGGSSTNLMQINVTTNDTFFLEVILVTRTAGTGAILQVNSQGSFGVSAGGGAPIQALVTNLNDALLSGTIAGNLTGGSIDFKLTTTALSTGSSLTMTCYILESLGFRTG